MENKVSAHSDHPVAFPVEVRLKVVEDFLLYGSYKKAGDINGVSQNTVSKWKHQPWWKEFEDEILAQRAVATTNKIAGVVDIGLDVVQNRLVEGDFSYNQKTGEIYRQPVKLKDAASAVNGLMQRAQALQKTIDKQGNKEATKTINEHLQVLATEFAKFNKRTNNNAIDIAFKES